MNELYEMAKVVAAGFLIFRRLGANVQYLLLQASNEENHWTPPKGHVDPGESEMETALRETQEEAGLGKGHFNIIDGFQKILHYEVRGKLKKVVYWLAELKDPNTPVLLSDEHIKYEWLGLQAAMEYSKYKDMQETLQEADAFINDKLGKL